MKEKATNGYIKVCASWIKRMWGMKKTDSNLGLNKNTYIFDTCGTYDFKNDGAVISKGSEKQEWSDALSFLEWYGIPHMEGFGLVILDD